MRVRVLRRHITKGVRKNGSRCAIALSLRDLGFKKVSVGGRISAYKGKTRFNWGLPYGVGTFIDRFDGLYNRKDRMFLKPFTFTLDRSVGKVN